MTFSKVFLSGRIFRPEHISWLLLCWLFVITPVLAQQLDQMGVKKGVKVSGGLGLNQSLYVADGVENRFNPYNYMVSGNVAFNMFGINVPLSFSYSNRNFSYSQPFNIIGLSPSYKSVTLHGGYRTMSFSPYTLAGHNFLGGGADWSQKGFKVSAMGGRLLKAIEYDSANSYSLPTYDRWGTGIMLSYGKNGDEIKFITFYARDQANSIRPLPDLLGIKPMENQIYSWGFKKNLSPVVSVYLEGARSGLTRDTRDTNKISESGLEKVYFLDKNQTTDFQNALKTGFNFNLKTFQVGINFERVDPGFNTLGAYYVNSDFQNVTGSFSTKLFKSKLGLNASGGVQRDDLSNQKLSSMKRFVGSLNMNMNFSKRLNASLAYSSFNSHINIKPVDQAFVQNTIYDRIDTLNFIQVNQSISGSVNYIPLENSRVNHQISLGGNYNSATNDNAGIASQNAVAGGRLGYMVTWKETGLNLGLNANSNANYYENGNANFVGLGMMMSKAVFKKKMRVSLNGNASNNYEKGNLTAMLYSVTNSYSLKVGKHHAISASLRYSGRQSRSAAELSYYQTTFNEFMGNLGYNFSF